ncbi:hypothetical protein B9Z55_007871 [Caenorhabditis nigoni]|uniref:BTB domain-containing protein n=1 Tax=Caenorhabditis nigoni TaxID=1611254 RepID=A0A2G5VBM7_9PELO|nr:hypothetical protein B9Z55_007871 [Caenorhabditis nigoni]
MFFQGFEESKKDVVELKEVSAEAFQLFLELISGYNRLCDENIEGITKISAMWQAEIPLGKCLKFLMKKSELLDEEKLILADKYDLAVLKNFLFDDVKSIFDMELLLPDTDIANFKPDTILMIAKKFMEINEIHQPMLPDSPIAQQVDSDADDIYDEEEPQVIRHIQPLHQNVVDHIGRLLAPRAPEVAPEAAPEVPGAPGRVGEAPRAPELDPRDYLGDVIRLRNLQRADRNAQNALNAQNGRHGEAPAAPVAPGLAPRAPEAELLAQWAAELAPRGLGAPDLAPAAPGGIQAAPRAQLPYPHAFAYVNGPQNDQQAVWNGIVLRNAQNAYYFQNVAMENQLRPPP